MNIGSHSSHNLHFWRHCSTNGSITSPLEDKDVWGECFHLSFHSSKPWALPLGRKQTWRSEVLLILTKTTTSYLLCFFGSRGTGWLWSSKLSIFFIKTITHQNRPVERQGATSIENFLMIQAKGHLPLPFMVEGSVGFPEFPCKKTGITESLFKKYFC